jgi:nicotinic acid mononucleotide adenylyltransferase
MSVTIDQLEQIITAIHATPQMMVLEFAGAGVQALGWLHRVAGSSRTVLEAADRYAASSLIEAIGFSPKRFTAPEVARALANRAYFRATHLVDPPTPVAGIGCTATIATDRAKRGEHRCCVAACTDAGVRTYALTLEKGRRSRLEEEELVSLLMLKAVADVSGVSGLPDPELLATERVEMQFEALDLLSRLMAGEVAWVFVSPDGRMTTAKTWPRLALLSGAFNPLHEGHRRLAEVAAKKLQQDVFFELPLVNADKSPLIDPDEVRRRMAQFAGFAPLILTRAPLFSQKARFFPGSVFILGVDTVERLAQPRFYHDDPTEMQASFEAVRTAGCRYLVAGRSAADGFLTLAKVELPAEYEDLFEAIPENEFRIDISSTAIRNNRG